ncbi:hypothetical protein OIC43_08195 [Streptomyces sp. NBC_00825]|uniref:hypothetical protein n=1 Tax=unclassified Streptomyces TaxID=2593676 RepID=UPI002ED6B671|nr:hypothetical protein OG832_35510 [Streptomyces sp. NBC_00826]WTH89040.1 hypothetical protein OIC43_08195 [Streptomyces sp. NBC_00825]WTH97770.1 hypothetical protein OHA23_08200 [Streptomyces sp. NBC_00822]
MDAFTAWLRAYYLDVSDDEAVAHWRSFVARSPELAVEELRCISEVAASPPKDLVLVIEQYASMYTWKKHRRIPWTHDDYVAWLKGKVFKFSEIAERHGLPSVTPEDREARS